MTDSAKMRHDLATQMLEITENYGPIIDAADGIKADMERRGWSPTAAESVALTWLNEAVAFTWRQSK